MKTFTRQCKFFTSFGGYLSANFFQNEVSTLHQQLQVIHLTPDPQRKKNKLWYSLILVYTSCVPFVVKHCLVGMLYLGSNLCNESSYKRQTISETHCESMYLLTINMSKVAGITVELAGLWLENGSNSRFVCQ